MPIGGRSIVLGKSVMIKAKWSKKRTFACACQSLSLP
jgi:hypothetical protein